MFMVWCCHRGTAVACESSPGSFDECKTAEQKLYSSVKRKEGLIKDFKLYQSNSRVKLGLWG